MIPVASIAPSRSLPTWRLVAWLLGWASILGCLPAAAEGLAPDETPVSVIQIPIELDLGPLFAAAETALPTQAGPWPGSERRHGFDVRYQAWRGPLQLAMRGPVLEARAHVRYRLQARKGLIGGLGLSASCGVDEPPRQALVGVLARLDWAPDWTLHPRFRVLPTRPLDACEVTLADIDVTPLIAGAFESRMESALRDGMKGLAPRLAGIRAEAERVWRSAQVPREVTPGLWLRARPVAVALGPLEGQGARLSTVLAVSARLTLGSEAGEPASATPLPYLMRYRPISPGLRFELGLELDYGAVSTALASRLVGSETAIEGRAVRIDGVRLFARGDDLVLEADLAGALAGRLSVMSRPGFDAESQSLTLENLDYVLDAEDPAVSMLAGMAYDAIRKRVHDTANALLAERTQAAWRSLAESLRAETAVGSADAIQADVSGLRLARLTIIPRETGLAITGEATGTLRMSR